MDNRGGQAQQQLRPFRLNTQKRINANSADNFQAHAMGSVVNYQFDKEGALAGIWFMLRGVVTLSNTGVLTNRSPWNLVKRFRLTLNNNAVTVIDIDGYHAYQMGKIMARAWAVDGGGVYTPGALGFAAPVASGANTWCIPYFLPISLNQGSDVLTGAINMQARTANLTLEVTMETTGTNVVSNFTSAALVGEVYNTWYELRDNTENPPLLLVTTQQKTDPIVATGETDHEIIPQGDLIQLVNEVILNGARNSADVIAYKYKQASSKFPHIIPPQLMQNLYSMNYSKACDTGIFVSDFFYAMDVPNSGDNRDIIHTDNFTRQDIIVDINSAASLGSGNNFFHTTERRIILLTAN